MIIFTYDSLFVFWYYNVRTTLRTGQGFKLDVELYLRDTLDQSLTIDQSMTKEDQDQLIQINFSNPKYETIFRLKYPYKSFKLFNDDEN